MKARLDNSFYLKLAPFYDIFFNHIFQQGRKLAAQIINKNLPIGGKVLEVGVGTGLSLSFYRKDLKLTGIDTSKGMLQIARNKIFQGKIPYDTFLFEMNAEDMQFPDNEFNAVVAMHVVSVTPNTPNILHEIYRVCEPGGKIIIANYFLSNNAFIKSIEKMILKYTRALGLGAALEKSMVAHYKGYKLVSAQNIDLFGLWHLLHFKKM